MNLDLRQQWLTAAQTYYLGHGDFTGMTDETWDQVGRLLFEQRHTMPWCPILNHPGYTGGSLYWVRPELYECALAAGRLAMAEAAHTGSKT